MKTLLIGIGHKARHGKDFLANEIHAELPRETKIYSFGNALKAYCRVQGWMTVKDGKLLQEVGTDLFRDKVDPDIWVKCLAYQLEEERPKCAIIGDLRFPNEHAWIKTRGGMVVKVSRLNEDGTPFVAPDRPAEHYSENALNDHVFDMNVVAKSGDIAELQRWADKIVHLIKSEV